MGLWKFSTSPCREGGGGREKSSGGAPGSRKRWQLSYLLAPGGSPAGWWAGEGGAGFVPYPEGLVRPGKWGALKKVAGRGEEIIYIYFEEK